ncbi:MAG: adenylate/guanylate cyclase domain-containing protein [Burkholderiaceae bacterium]
MKLTRRGALWLAAGALALLGAWHAAVSPLAPLSRLDTLLDDLQQRHAAAAAAAMPHPDITIVDIDEASLAAIGRWPWPRERLAALVDELAQRQRVAAIGFDLVFAEPDPGAWPALAALAESEPSLAAPLAAHAAAWRERLDQDARFAAALAHAPVPVVLGAYVTADRGGARHGALPPPWLPGHDADGRPYRLPAWTGYGANLARLAEAAPRVGVFNALPDDDGVLRRVPALVRLDDGLQPSLALALWRGLTGRPALGAESSPLAGAAELDALVFELGDGRARRVHLDEQGALRVPFGGRGRFRHVPAAALLAGQLAPGSLAGQVVLVGSSAPGLADLKPTPIHPSLPGVDVHAHLLAGLLAGDMPYRPAWAPGFELMQLLLVLGLAALAASRLGPSWALVAVVVLGMALLLAHGLAAAGPGWVLPRASALVLGGVLGVGVLLVSFLREWDGRRSLFRLFSLYLPADRARALARDGAGQAMAADNRELTVLFCDLRGFTSLSEGLAPDALRELLNLYFSRATEIIHAHGGTLDKFIGDAVMAFWGAPQAQPDHARRAVDAALALAASLPGLNAELATRGLPPLRLGVGLATGVACVGDLGSRLRRSYTAVGDTVNLAARLEALTRELGVDVLVADTTHAACGELPGMRWVERGQHAVRGRRQAVTLFTPEPASPA